MKINLTKKERVCVTLGRTDAASTRDTRQQHQAVESSSKAATRSLHLPSVIWR